MFVSHHHTVTRRLIRITLVVAALAVLALFALSRLGTFLVVQDPLEKADVIFVLGGTRFERPLEAVDLYNEGWAPRIMLFRQVRDFGEIELLKRGFDFMLESDVQADALRRMGVPPDAVIILGERDNTKEEAQEIHDQVIANRWSRIIIVTSQQHTRRARLVASRKLDGTGVKVIVRGSRYDRTDPEYWWRDRPTLRFTIFEAQRLLGYWIGVGD
jgi:uncharacterized SAM-binding protein YcdF (DUF218 family)